MPKAGAPSETWIGVLGRGQDGADGIQDYCTHLGKGLASRGVTLRVSRVEWRRLGWRRALAELRRESRAWRGDWVLLQYTALGFSSRGFPLRAVTVMRILRGNGARCAVVFHDPFRQGGRRLRDRLRGTVQEWVIRRIFELSERAIFPDPLSKIPWLPKQSTKGVCIPIGANIPECPVVANGDAKNEGGLKTVVVFCLSLDAVMAEEMRDLSVAARTACEKGARFRLIFLGRGTAEAREAISAAFLGVPVEISILGILDAEKVAEVLSGADIMLCVRGMIYPRRGSAIAGIASGLAVLGYAGEAEGTPLVEAGVILVPYRDAAALGRELAKVLGDSALEAELREKSHRAYGQYYSWDLIAGAFRRALEGPGA